MCVVGCGGDALKYIRAFSMLSPTHQLRLPSPGTSSDTFSSILTQDKLNAPLFALLVAWHLHSSLHLLGSVDIIFIYAYLSPDCKLHRLKLCLSSSLHPQHLAPCLEHSW